MTILFIVNPRKLNTEQLEVFRTELDCKSVVIEVRKAFWDSEPPLRIAYFDETKAEKIDVTTIE